MKTKNIGKGVFLVILAFTCLAADTAFGDNGVGFVVGGITTRGQSNNITIAGDYAYISNDDDGVLIADISDPLKPNLLADRVFPKNGTKAVAVSGDYLYMAHDDDGLIIFKLNEGNPGSPQLVQDSGCCRDPNGATDIVVKGDYAYISHLKKGLYIVNVSDKQSPVEVNKPITTIDGIGTLGDAVSVAVEGNHAYLICGVNLHIISIGNKQNPHETGRLRLGAGGGKGIVIDGDYAYISRGNGLFIVDIKNKRNPQLASRVNFGSTAFGVDVVGSHAYVSCDESLYVLNVVDKKNPRVIAAPGYGKAGGRGVAVSGDYAFVAHDTWGLSVADISKCNRTPVVFVPGIMCTELWEKKDDGWGRKIWLNKSLSAEEWKESLACDTDGEPIDKGVTPRRIFKQYAEGGENVYGDFIERLKAEAYSVYECPYDWRLEVSTQRGRLEETIQWAMKDHRAKQVYVLAHSLGGLLTRRHLQDQKNHKDERIKRIIYLATSHRGTPAMYYLLLTGDFGTLGWGLSNEQRNMLRCMCRNYASVHEVLPTYKFVTGKDGNPAVFYSNNEVYGAVDSDFPDKCLTTSYLTKDLLEEAKMFHQRLPSAFAPDTVHITGYVADEDLQNPRFPTPFRMLCRRNDMLMALDNQGDHPVPFSSSMDNQSGENYYYVKDLIHFSYMGYLPNNLTPQEKAKIQKGINAVYALMLFILDGKTPGDGVTALPEGVSTQPPQSIVYGNNPSFSCIGEESCPYIDD